MPKLVIVGAGSAVFTQGLIMDLIATQGGEPWELGLVDTNAEALDVVTRLARKMVAGKEAPITVSGSTDRHRSRSRRHVELNPMRESSHAGRKTRPTVPRTVEQVAFGGRASGRSDPGVAGPRGPAGVPSPREPTGGYLSVGDDIEGEAER